MLIETLSVREAREQLPSVLERFRNGDRTPVGVGSHRKTEAVMVPVEVFDDLTAERARSLTQAAASVRAAGLTGGYDLAHLQLFHKEIFGDLYPWAGEIRVVGIAKSDPFCGLCRTRHKSRGFEQHEGFSVLWHG
jgi:PHD/YefM family antitoxin component YafN of YafNO toxin-antitoxin module